MPLLRAAVMSAFGLIGVGMLAAAAFALVSAGGVFLGVMLAVMGGISLTITFLMRRYS